METLVLSAARFESEPLLNGFEALGIDIEFREVGIGALHAARNARSLGSAARGKHVIYIGTCGSVAPFSKPYLVRASDVAWLPPCERANLAWSIEGIEMPYGCPNPPAWAMSLPTRQVIGSPTISRSWSRPDHISQDDDVDLWVENLELYSCGREIIAQAKSFVAILAVTNALCEEGRRQWKQYFQPAAALTADFVLQNMLGEDANALEWEQASQSTFVPKDIGK